MKKVSSRVVVLVVVSVAVSVIVSVVVVGQSLERLEFVEVVASVLPFALLVLSEIEFSFKRECLQRRRILLLSLLLRKRESKRKKSDKNKEFHFWLLFCKMFGEKREEAEGVEV